jgi:hypothetical protein
MSAVEDSIYEPLARGTIRLLHIPLGRSGEPISYSLEEVYFDDLPPYTDLSYTWRNLTKDN